MVIIDEKHDNKFERQRTSSLRLRNDDKTLKPVDDKYFTKLIRVPDDRVYPILEFTKTIEGIPDYYPRSGYGFYEFTKPEFISHDKQVILMDKVLLSYYKCFWQQSFIIHATRMINYTMVLVHDV